MTTHVPPPSTGQGRHVVLRPSSASRTGRGARRGRRTPASFRRLGLWAALATVVALVFVAAFVRTYRVTGPSMEPTHPEGQVVVATRLGGLSGPVESAVEVGDVVVLDATAAWGDRAEDGGELRVVKRVVAGPGDTITCCTAGAMVRNGEPVPARRPGGEGLDSPFEVVLGPDEWWVVGDDPSASNDSRTHLAAPGGGAVRSEELVAHVRWGL
ncbi:signal peptidase I [Kytococcus aerolatus]|uniref:Signal peptidase I n=1 Tax=Kytococcus aerolatus TaxID=592308 RepID=A0A212U1V1_9MICO|nr:signal peptidase I [Kytococcus aerolatus]SNC72203.1 signal peptidase I [Kytococcus aerolatus]